MDIRKMREDKMNYYDLLEISRNASIETIRGAYKIQMKKYHPDNLNTGDTQKMQELNIAYQTLVNPKLRAEYDRKLDMEFVNKDNLESEKAEYQKTQNIQSESKKGKGCLGCLFIIIILCIGFKGVISLLGSFFSAIEAGDKTQVVINETTETIEEDIEEIDTEVSESAENKKIDDVEYDTEKIEQSYLQYTYDTNPCLLFVFWFRQ